MKHAFRLVPSMFSIILLLAVSSLTFTPAQAANQQRQILDELTWELIYTAPVGQIGTLAEYNGFLYAGTQDNYQFDGRLFRYDGTEWIELNIAAEVGNTIDLIDVLRIFDNKLFIGTRSALPEGKKACVYSYDGTTFSTEYCGPSQSGYSGIEEIIVHEDYLYASNGSRYSEVYRRDLSGNWIKLGASVNPNNPVRALAFYEGELYAGTGTHGNEAQIWKWNGAVWEQVINLAQHFNFSQDGVLTIINFNDALYISLAGPGIPSPLIKFDGQNWIIHEEFNEGGSTQIMTIDNSIWLGTFDGAVYQLNENDEWEYKGSTGATFTSTIVKYNNQIYAGTYYEGEIFRAAAPNHPPTVNSGGPYSVPEGGMIPLSATGLDPDEDPLIYSWDLDGDGTYETSGQNVNFSAVNLDGPDMINISVMAEDPEGLSASEQTIIEILNVPPEIVSFEITPEPMKIMENILVSASFTDPGIPDTHTAIWNWGDGTQSTGQVIEDLGSGTVSGAHIYLQPGLYTINLRVSDDDGEEDVYTYQYLVVINPNKDFVTGAGWFNSPVGAYTQNPDLNGKFFFNFTVKYYDITNNPDGIFNLRFYKSSFDFSSRDFEWLIITDNKALISGTGKLNDEPGYAFLISAVDTGINMHWSKPDILRIRIWDMDTNEIVYDNEIGSEITADPVTPLEAGEINIH